VTWAARKLRAVAADHYEPPTRWKPACLFRPPPRPPVDDRPVLWKALYFDFRQVRSVAGRSFARVVFLLSFLPVAAVIVEWAMSGGRWFRLPDVMNEFIVRGLGTMVLSGLLVMIAAYTSGSIAGERRKKTLDDLLLTDLSAEEILGQKWWASFLVLRWGLVWVGIHWLVAMLTGGLSPLAVPVLVLEWSAYAACAASLGIYCAVRWPKARQAGVWTGILGFLAAILPVFVALLVSIAAEDSAREGWWGILPGAMSPPVALGVSGFYGDDLRDMIEKNRPQLALLVIGAATSIVLSVLLSRLLWRRACQRFRRAVG